MTGIEKVTQFLKDAETYYLATVEGPASRKTIRNSTLI